MKNIMQMMQKAQELQKKMEEAQNQLKRLEFTSSSGGGLLTITMNGDFEIKNINIDDSIVNVTEKDMLSDLFIAAYNDVRNKIKEESANRMKSLTAGLPLPEGMKIPGF